MYVKPSLNSMSHIENKKNPKISYYNVKYDYDDDDDTATTVFILMR